MNTQNNEQEELLDLLMEGRGKATSQDVDSQNLRIHLKNRLGNQKVVEALIDYASVLEKVKCEVELDADLPSYFEGQKF